MNRVQRYIKVFGKASLLAGALFGLAMGVRVGLWNGLLAGVLFALVWGLLMAIVLIPADLILTRRIPADALDVNQSREFEVQKPQDFVFRSLEQIFSQMRSLKVVTPFPDKGLIRGRTKASWASFGEDIAVEVKALDENRTRVIISSRPATRRTSLDYGTNFRNVEFIEKSIRASSDSPA